MSFLMFLFFFFSLCSKDVRLPVQLQRAMAAEAEAAREARAKVRDRQGCHFPYPTILLLLSTPSTTTTFKNGGGGGDISASSSLNLPPPRSATTFKKCWINAGKGPQPPTVECKTEAQSEYANIAYTFLFLHACCRLVCSVGAKLTKFLRRSSGGSLLRVCCWLGKTSLFFPPHFCT